MALAPVDTPITDHFDDPDGRWRNYDAYDTAQGLQLRAQRHRDIRCFVPPSQVQATMYDLTHLSMSAADTMRLDNVSHTPALGYSETWTRGSLAKQADRNHWWGLSLPCAVGTTTTASFQDPVDLLTGFTDDDFISIALPAFPAGSLNLGQCFLIFDADGGSTMLQAFEGLTAGDTELRIPRSDLFTDSADRDHALRTVGTVTFRFVATAATTVRILAIRMISADWTYAPLDLNTLTGTVVRPVSLNGSAHPTSAFPTSNIDDAQVPTDWPILLRAHEPSGRFDPRPIDLSLATMFGTGAMTGGDLRLYFREAALDLVTQIDLDNADGAGVLSSSELATYSANGGRGVTQRELNAYGRALDFDTARFHVKDQTDLDPYMQSQLDTQPQYDLETKPDLLSAMWVQVALSWTQTGATLSIRDTEGNGYAFTPTLVANTRYALIVTLDDCDLRVRIYSTDTGDRLDPANLAFDSTIIRDDFLLSRRAGRVGWYARFDDGDAYIDSLRPFHANFGEYRSVPFRSISPVVGGQVFFGGSPSRELVTGVQDLNGGLVFPDRTKSNSDAAYRVDTFGNAWYEGIATNDLHIENFAETILSFQLWMPSDITHPALNVFLVDAQGRPHPLNLGRIEVGKWQPWQFALSSFEGSLLPGYYRIYIVFAERIKSSFYVDALSLRQQSISWHGRADAGDAWGDNASPWMHFGECVNGQTNGVLFPTNGTAPQVRALARRQDATLTQVKFLPRYATLGRLVWADEAPTRTTPQMSGFTAAVTARTVRFSLAGDQVTLDSGNYIVYYEWTFGDGTVAVGPNVAHVYDAAGTYTPTLLVVDNEGSRGWYAQNVTVT